MRTRSLATLFTLGVLTACSASASTATLPDPTYDAPKTAAHGYETAVLAGGCFWGMQSVFEHVRGVRHVLAGYSGGHAGTAHYEQVSDGSTGHAESVQVEFDPSVVSYGQLLKVYFGVAHDPTQLNRQGPDTGTQYRSEIFTANAEQQKIAQSYIAQLNTAHVFNDAIVTQVQPLKAFYTAEAYHQDYARLHPDEFYIVVNDAPKVTALKQLYPTLYQPEETFVQVKL